MVHFYVPSTVLLELVKTGIKVDAVDELDNCAAFEVASSKYGNLHIMSAAMAHICHCIHTCLPAWLPACLPACLSQAFVLLSYLFAFLSVAFLACFPFCFMHAWSASLSCMIYVFVCISIVFQPSVCVGLLTVCFVVFLCLLICMCTYTYREMALCLAHPCIFCVTRRYLRFLL